MKFADVKPRDVNHKRLLDYTIIDCFYCGNKSVIDDDLFWKMLTENNSSRSFLTKNHIYSLEQLVEDYTRWYEVENAEISHYEYGDDRILYFEE